MKVLLMTLQNPPPTLEGNYSRAFKEMVEICLQKDPAKRYAPRSNASAPCDVYCTDQLAWSLSLSRACVRACSPTAAKLLEHKFFKQAMRPEYVVAHLLASLPPLWERVRITNQGVDLESVKRRVLNDGLTDSDEEAWSFGKSLTQALDVESFHSASASASSAIAVPGAGGAHGSSLSTTPPSKAGAAIVGSVPGAEPTTVLHPSIECIHPSGDSCSLRYEQIGRFTVSSSVPATAPISAGAPPDVEVKGRFTIAKVEPTVVSPAPVSGITAALAGAASTQAHLVPATAAVAGVQGVILTPAAAAHQAQVPKPTHAATAPVPIQGAGQQQQQQQAQQSVSSPAAATAHIVAPVVDLKYVASSSIDDAISRTSY